MKSKILIIQNAEPVEGYLRDQLTGSDYEIIGSISSLQEALSVVAVQSPDLMLLDVLPEQALETIETAKALLAGCPCPLLCLLSTVDEQILQALHLLEPVAYLIKPVNEKELRFAVQLAQRQCQINDELIKAKKALVESEKQAAELLENLPIGVYRTTPQGKILYANPTLVKMLGYGSFAEVTARDLSAEDFEPSYSRQEFCDRLERENQIIGLEALWQRPDGGSMFVRENVRVLRDNDGAVLYYEGTVEDITESRAAEARLHCSTEPFKSLFNNAPYSMVIYTLDRGRIVDINDTCLQRSGLKRDEVVGRSLKEIKMWIDYHGRKQIAQLLRQNGSIRNLEVSYRVRNGKERIGLYSAEVMEFNQEICVIGAMQDITELKQTENVLRELTARFQTVFNLAPHPMLISRFADGKLINVNETFTQVFGYEKADVIGRTSKEFGLYVNLDDREKLYRLLSESGSVHNLELLYRHKNGEVRIGLSSAEVVEVDEQKIAIAAITDITDRKQAEEALRASQERFQKLAVNSSDHIYLIDLTEKRAVYHNRDQMFGYENAELNNYGFLKSLIYFDDKERVQENWLHLLSGNTGSVEFRLRKKDGTWDWLDCRYKALYFDEHGKPLHSLLTTSIITERKLAEELLQKYANELNDLYQHAPCGYYSIDGEGTIVRMNDTELHWLGYARDEVIGRRKYWELVRIGDLEYDKQQFSLLKKRGWIKDLEGELIRKDGSTMPVLLSATAVKDENGNFLHSRSTIYDMTERARTEEIIRKSNERLQALSAHLLSVREEERTRIAREIHDEFGPMLTILKFDLFALGKKLTEGQHDLLERIRFLSSQIDEAVGSVRKICSDLRPAILDFGLPAAIEWLTTDFEKLTGVKCHVQLKIADMVFTEEVSTALFRILQEGLTNVARHAEATAVHVVLESVNDRLELSIADNGKGISPEDLSSLRSFGLLGIRERTRLLGGEATITGNAETGTQLQLFIPLAQTKEFQYVQKHSGNLWMGVGK